MISIAKALGTFEEKGLSVDKVRDLYGLRECSALLKAGNAQAFALLNEGKSPRAVREAIQPKKKPDSEPTPDQSEPVNLVNEKDKFGQLMLAYADKFALLAENEDRLKITRQIVAKMNLGGYMLLHTDAAKAVESLKARR